MGLMEWSIAEPQLMPRIQPESIFEQLNPEQIAHVPFINGTVIVFVADLPHMTASITTEQMLRWGQTPETLEAVARRNLDRSCPAMAVQFVESSEGGKAALISQYDGYDAARLLLGGLYGRLAPQLGRDFLVAIPARDMFVAFSRGPGPFIERLRARVARDYRCLPDPIVEDFFLVTRDGIAPAEEALPEMPTDQ